MLEETNRVLDPEVLKSAPAGTEVWRIWPGPGNPPGSESWDWNERIAQVPWTDVPRLYARNVVIPTVTVHRPAPGAANGTAMIVAPGGAFHFLMMDHEGHMMAQWLTRLGVTAFVLRYRLLRTPDGDAEMEVPHRPAQAARQAFADRHGAAGSRFHAGDAALVRRGRPPGHPLRPRPRR